jgi:phage terminase large subunit-like protein
MNRDSAAVALVQHQGERIVCRVMIWEPRGGVIPYDEMRQHLRDAADQYDLRSVAYDARFWLESAQMLADEGLLMVEVPQSPERMTPMCGRGQEVVLSGQLAHDGGEELNRHVANAAKKQNDRGFTFSKVKSGAKIDGWIALILAIGESEAPQEDTTSIYESRGLAFLS